MADKDYSGTPLWKKLGIKDGGSVAIVRAPEDVSIAIPPGAQRLAKPVKNTDVILLFATRLKSLETSFVSTKPKLASNGGLWVAYPKQSSSLATDLTFENVQAVGLDAGMVDNKSCAIDGNWSAVRFVYRLKDRPP
ncbi:MAG: DUF3052 domain-containing protein [Actinomycetota bacterium]